MSNVAAMRKAGRKIRRALDNYISELQAAREAGVVVAASRVMADPATGEERPMPQPGDIYLTSTEVLGDIRFSYTVTEALTEDDIEPEAGEPET